MKFRQPYFWLSILILLFIIIDAICQYVKGNSLLQYHHYQAMRVLDLILSVSVFLQSHMMEKLLEEKDDIHLKQGYAKGRLTSPFLQMRRTQLKLISYSYLIANMLVVIELIVLFGTTTDSLATCSGCAMPNTNGSALYLFMLTICHLVPTHLFLYSFYIIPRRFNVATEAENMSLVNDPGALQTPLLDENLNAVGSSMTWQKEHDRQSSFSGSQANISANEKCASPH